MAIGSETRLRLAETYGVKPGTAYLGDIYCRLAVIGITKRSQNKARHATPEQPFGFEV